MSGTGQNEGLPHKTFPWPAAILALILHGLVLVLSGLSFVAPAMISYQMAVPVTVISQVSMKGGGASPSPKSEEAEGSGAYQTPNLAVASQTPSSETPKPPVAAHKKPDKPLSQREKLPPPPRPEARPDFEIKNHDKPQHKAKPQDKPDPAARPSKEVQKPLDLDKLSQKKPDLQTHPNKSQSLDLDHLAATSSGKGQDRRNLVKSPVSGSQFQAGAKANFSADVRDYLAGKLMGLWHPNCESEAKTRVIVRVKIRLSPEGRVLSVEDVTGSENDLVKAEAVRALTAVTQAAPYDALPKDSYSLWREIRFNFIARDACASNMVTGDH